MLANVMCSIHFRDNAMADRDKFYKVNLHLT